MEASPELHQTSRIELGRLAQAPVLADFQIKMALETENFQLDRQLVEKAIEYFYSSGSKDSTLGMYLVKLEGDKVVGCLLLTFENQKSWWIQSVYVAKQARRKGHFTSLFQEALRLGKQKGVTSIRLYAQNDNLRAKTTYQKLGMNIISEKMYSYDFVYGKIKVDQQQQNYQIQRVNRDSPQLQQWVKQRVNVLTGEKYSDDDWDNTFSLTKEGQLYALIKTFTQFSDWRFGLAWYIRQIYTQTNHNQNYQQMINEIMQHILKTSQPKAAVIRVLFREGQGIDLKGGQLDHYDVLEIKL